MKSKLLVLLASVALFCSCETIDTPWDLASRWDLEKYTVEGVVVSIEPAGADQASLRFTTTDYVLPAKDVVGNPIRKLGCYSTMGSKFPIPYGNIVPSKPTDSAYRLSVDNKTIEVWNIWDAENGSYTTTADQTFTIVKLKAKFLTIAEADGDEYMFAIGN